MTDTALPPDDQRRGESPLSLKRLTSAFAAMLGRTAAPAAADRAGPKEPVVDTRSITEALLFVGRPDNRPLSAEAIAETMRGVTADEVHAAVAELNASYQAEQSALTIEPSAAGYRLVLREELHRVRQRFHGKVQQTTLSPVAMEVLAVVAYRQPIAMAEIDALRGQKSQSLVSGLVRRGLVRLERPDQSPERPHYVTTERFLRVFHLRSLDQLPQAEEFAPG